MEFLDLFEKQHIRDVIKRTCLYPEGTEISFSEERYNAKEKFTLLNLTGNKQQKYILVNITEHHSENFKPKQHSQAEHSKVLYPVFIIKNINKEYFGAFDYQHGMEQFILPEQNNTEFLKIILQNLAEHQAPHLNNREEPKHNGMYDLKHITNEVIRLDFFKSLDQAMVKQSIEKLQSAINKLLTTSNLLVNSIWQPFANNVYIRPDTKESIFLSIPVQKIVPPAYDAILYIFTLSNAKFRQEHFESLISYYFSYLAKCLEKLQSNVANKLTRSYREHQVKVLLPAVKFNVVGCFFKLGNSPEVQEILTNISHFLKYSLINQEDIHEAIKNKIGSTHYDLFDFNLVPLREKNGHLGEYFHLGIKIKTGDKEQDLQLFAKFLIPPTEAMEKVLKSGPAKKEDFFYETLLPLFAHHGLGDLLDFAPRCYLSRIDWLLILDDLSQQDYVGFKPNTVLNYEGLRAIVKNFAKLHACAIILEENLSKKSGKTVRLDELYGEYFEETMLIYEDGHHLKRRYDLNLEIMYYILNKFPDITKKLKASPKEIRSCLKKIFFSIFDKVRKSDIIRNVINHGDGVVANMLFKFGESNSIINGILIDFQMLRYVTPTYDLLVFLFSNSTKETRKKYLKTLIEDYYQCITENLTKFNYEPEAVFPKKIFEEDINFMKSAAVVGAFMYAHILHIDPDFREEIAHDQEKYNYYFNNHRDELVDLAWKDEHYRNIMKGLVEDIVDIIKNAF